MALSQHMRQVDTYSMHVHIHMHVHINIACTCAAYAARLPGERGARK